MTDIPVQVPPPQIQVPLGEASAALPQIVTSTPAPVPSNLLTNPIPYQPRVVNSVDEAMPADWHPKDPIARGAAAGHLAVYAQQQPGGLSDAAQHWATFSKMAESGMIRDEGDTKEVVRLWRKFRAAPQTMKPDESASLLNAVSRVGAATAQSPDLKFDPVGRVKSVGAGGEVRVAYPAKTNVRDLSLQPLAPPAIERLRTLLHMGQGATKDVPLQDLLAPFLGMDLGRVGDGLIGRTVHGNIDLHNRPVAHNADGSISTVRSMSISDDSGSVVIPTVVGGKVVSNDEAIRHYQQTGEHLGKFIDDASADRYAESLHESQAREYLPGDANSVLEQAVNGLADELKSSPEQVRAAIAAGWAKLRVPTRPWEKPFTVGANNPAADALNDGLSANVIDAMRGGVNALDFTTPGSLVVATQPAGGLAVSADPTERNLRLLRHLYPAFTQNGVTAWLPGEAAPTESAAKLPGEVYNDFFLRANGGHPLFRPGVSIAYDATDTSHPGEDLGPVLSTQPALKMDRVRPFEIDPDKFDELIQSNAWALIPGGNATRASLIKSGYNPISHNVGDSTQNVGSWLVFGITAAQARAHAAGEIVTNAGTYTHDGFRPGSGVSFDRAGDGKPSTTRLPGGDVHWFLDGVDRDAPPEEAPGHEVTQVRSRRRLVNVSGDLQSAVGDLESRGGKNLRVYAHQNALDGFHTAYEHVYTDGTNTTSVLTKKPTHASHAGPVLVRSTEGLPDTFTPPQTSRQGTQGTFLNGVQVVAQGIKKVTDLKGDLHLEGNTIVPVPHSGDATVAGGKIVVNNPSPAAARLVAAAKATGLQDSDFRGTDTAELKRSPVASARTISGDRVMPIKQTRPSEAWANRFGIVFDPGWRDAGGVQQLDPKLDAHLQNVYQTFLDQHAAASNLWGLQRIAVTSAYTKSPAYTEWGGLGGSIGLSAKHWADPALLTDHVIRLQNDGTIVPNVPPTPAYFVAHELGHVVHGALQFGTDGSGARQQILAIRKRLGRDGIVKGLSAQAWHSPEEMVAEAVAEGVLSSNPRPVAREILNSVVSAYSRVEASRTRRDW